MSNLTIDQILQEVREQVAPFYAEKQASAPSTSFEPNEVEKMAALLKEASLQPDQEEEEEPAMKVASMYEKVASSLILAKTLEALNEGSEKYASFYEHATELGHSEQEIEDYISKHASKSLMGKLVSSPVTKVTAALGAGTALAAGGASTGYKKGKKEENKKTQVAGLAGFVAGRKFQMHQDQTALEARKEQVKRYLLSQKEKSE
jgi:hypothetical protein